MRKAFSIIMMNQGCFTFFQKLFEKTLVQMTIFRKKAFGQMNFRSYDLSVN
jgi:hypothetical protein